MNLSDISAKITTLTGATTTDYTAAERLLDINIAIDKIHSAILESQTGWRIEDVNNAETDKFQGIAYADLVANQDNYSFPTGILKIHQVEVKLGGSWVEVLPLNSGEMSQSVEDYPFSTAQPYYKALGDHIILYPTPDSAVTGGLKVLCDRNLTLFTSGDLTAGTKVPGFDRNFHIMIPLECAVMFKQSKSLDPNAFIAQLNDWYGRLAQHYGSKQQDRKYEITPNIESYI